MCNNGEYVFIRKSMLCILLQHVVKVIIIIIMNIIVNFINYLILLLELFNIVFNFQ